VSLIRKHGALIEQLIDLAIPVVLAAVIALAGAAVWLMATAGHEIGRAVPVGFPASTRAGNLGPVHPGIDGTRVDVQGNVVVTERGPVKAVGALRSVDAWRTVYRCRLEVQGGCVYTDNLRRLCTSIAAGDLQRSIVTSRKSKNQSHCQSYRAHGPFLRSQPLGEHSHRGPGSLAANKGDANAPRTVEGCQAMNQAYYGRAGDARRNRGSTALDHRPHMADNRSQWQT
jgi:hypothetical protein